MRRWKVWSEPGGKNFRCRWKGIYGTGQQVFVREGDAEEHAKAKRQDFQRMDAGLPPALRVTDAVTVGTYAKTYLENSKKEKGARTYNNFDRPPVESFVAAYGKLALAAITDAHVRDWKFSTQAKYGATTANMYFRGLRTFLNAAVKAGHIAKSPALNVPRPAEGPGGRALKDEEVLALMTVAEDLLYRSGSFAMNTMLRLNEVCLFDWSWVYALPKDKWMARIPAGLRKTRGKVKEDCIVPITAQARAVMGKRELSGRVFPYSPVTIQHQFVRARIKAKLPDDVSFHSFRHTGASRYLKAGGHMEDLLKSRLWNDHRSLLRYVHVDEITLYERFSAMKNPHLAPKSKKTRRSPKGTTGR